MENLNIDQIIQLREKAIQGLVDQKAQLQNELNKITARLLEIDNQLELLGYHSPREQVPVRSTRRGQGRLYDYKAGQGFILLETGETIGPGNDENEALEAIKTWCASVNKEYYPTQWKRVINPNYGKS